MAALKKFIMLCYSIYLHLPNFHAISSFNPIVYNYCLHSYFNLN
jgi:hypothetical protein